MELITAMALDPRQPPFSSRNARLMRLSPDTLRQRLANRASQIYRSAGRSAFHFARGKLPFANIIL